MQERTLSVHVLYTHGLSAKPGELFARESFALDPVLKELPWLKIALYWRVETVNCSPTNLGRAATWRQEQLQVHRAFKCL